MQEYFVILQNCPLFAGITSGELKGMLACLGAGVRRFGKEETVFAEGAPAREIGILLSGAVQICRVDYFGNRSILANIAPGQLFGESFACAGVEELPVQVVALEESRVLHIDCSRLLRSCSNACTFHHRLIYNLMHVVAGKNLVFHQKLEILSKRTIREKLLSYLSSQAQTQNTHYFEIPLGRTELAEYLCVDRSALTRELAKMREEGLIDYDKNCFRIKER